MTRKYYTPRGAEIDLDKVEEWASRGLSIENMAALCGIGRRTLYDLREEDAQFAQDFDLAVESGKAQGVEVVANKLMELCLEGHPQSIQYFLERKGGFQKTENLNHTSSDGSMSPKESSAAVLDALKRKHAPQ